MICVFKNEQLKLHLPVTTVFSITHLNRGLTICVYKNGRRLNDMCIQEWTVEVALTSDNRLFNHFKQKLNDMCIQEWTVEVALTSDNRLFNHLKKKLWFESYLDINNRALRIAVTKIRFSSHLFMIERERWNVRKPDVSEQKCNVCNVIEDKYHCLL